MLLKIKIFIVFSTCCTGLFSQNYQAEDTTKVLKNLIIHKDSRIDNILTTYKSSYTLSGYRIQIFSDNKKQPARDEKAKFPNSFSSVKAHEVYQQPFFKIRVGDFRTKLEAYKFQKEIMAQFPNSFIVTDDIEVEQLIAQ